MAEENTCYKNWQVIAALQSPHLKRFLMRETEPAILEKARIVFPECFSDTPITLATYPASMLRAIAEQKSAREGNEADIARHDGELEWVRALGPEVPLVKFSRPDHNDVPFEIRKQLKGQKLQGGLRIRWECETYIVVGICDDGTTPLFETIEKIPNPEWLTLAPARFIDLRS